MKRYINIKLPEALIDYTINHFQKDLEYVIIPWHKASAENKDTGSYEKEARILRRAIKLYKEASHVKNV